MKKINSGFKVNHKPSGKSGDGGVGRNLISLKVKLKISAVILRTIAYSCHIVQVTIGHIELLDTLGRRRQ